ncbi:antirestriction protein ArdA [Nocardia sp. NPDC004068]|uniref:antirestriction protein ArdA n=1 Tax=Nocardia sp. NPDC004068 TaxID=3364303 RepID=UPI003676AF0A
MNERFPKVDARRDYRDDGAVPRAAESTVDSEHNQEQEPRLNPRIYVTAGLPLRAELTKGTWLAMARDPGVVRAELFAVLGEPLDHGIDRFYIWDDQDFGDFDVTTGAIGLEDVHSLELLSQVARGIAQHGPAFAAWASRYEDEPAQFDRFAAAYKGRYENIADYARQMVTPLNLEDRLSGALPSGLDEFVRIDYEAMGRQMAHDTDLVIIPAADGGVWVFGEGDARSLDAALDK